MRTVYAGKITVGFQSRLHKIQMKWNEQIGLRQVSQLVYALEQEEHMCRQRMAHRVGLADTNPALDDDMTVLAVVMF